MNKLIIFFIFLIFLIVSITYINYVAGYETDYKRCINLNIFETKYDNETSYIERLDRCNKHLDYL